MTFDSVMAVYAGSDGDATKALYERTQALGPAGLVAVNVFRALKNSERAKVYRGGIRGQGKYKQMAYARKDWAISNLCEALTHHGLALGIGWGWGVDPAAIGFEHVLYVDLPTGQVSYHTGHRGAGPDYAGKWDGARGTGPERVCRWIVEQFEQWAVEWAAGRRA